MTRYPATTCAFAVALAAGGAIVTAVHPFASARADSCADAALDAPPAPQSGACADVLAQERRWLTAITDGDRATVESILAPDFKHIDSGGRLVGRAQEIGAMQGCRSR